MSSSVSLNPPPSVPSIPPPPPPPPPDILVTPPDPPNPVDQPPGVIPPPKSFRDTLITGNSSVTPPLVTYEELVAANPESPMIDDGAEPSQTKVPKVKIPKSIWQRLCAPWKNAVIIKLLGKSMNFHVLHSRLLKEWRTEHEFEVIDVGMGYFIVRFVTPEDCSRVLTGGPYKFFDHYLAVQPWEPSFHPATAKAPKTAVWVKFHGVPSMCYQEAIVLYLASKLGKPIKVDSVTLLGTREKFARVCVEVDLSQKLPSSVDLDLEDLPQILIPVEYESLHKICFHCGEFGHTEDSCRYKNPEKSATVGNPSTRAMIELTQALKPEMVENNMVFGPWMVQQRKSRRRSQANFSQSQATNKSHIRSPEVPAVTEAGISAKTVAVTKHDRRYGESNSQQNRFEVFAEVMDKETDLLHALNGPHVLAGESSKVNEAVAPMDAAPTPIPETLKSTQTQNGSHQTMGPTPPPAPSIVKPNAKPSKRKGKTLGPIPKDTKISTQKPYELPPALKKHLPHTTQMLPSIQSIVQSSLGDSVSLVAHPSMSSPLMPCSSAPPLSEIDATHPQQITSPSESSLSPQHVGQVHILAVSPSTAAPSSTSSQ
ncbi:hypothetical protein SLE2022_080720 [Rubroshorea leprosula]